MNNVEDVELRRQYNGKQKQTRAMTDVEKAILAAELAKPEYAGLTVAEKLDKLNLPRTKPNPESEFVEKTDFKARELYNKLAQHVFSIDAATGDITTSWIQLSRVKDSSNLMKQAFDTLEKYAVGGEFLNKNNQLVVQLMPKLIEDGLLDQAEVDAVLLEKREGWTAQVPDDPLAVELFGVGAFVEAADIEACG
jgi:hypothetical protein